MLKKSFVHPLFLKAAACSWGKLCFILMIAISLAACSKETEAPVPDPGPIDPPMEVHEKIILLNEGNWQSDNGQLSFIENHEITNGWFKAINGEKLGDTPQHIVRINDNLLAISVNWSNIIHFIKPTGELVASTENVPNCRYMATDGLKYLYVTSYAHQTALGEEYEKGYVARIDIDSHCVTATCEVGYEPEGIAYYEGKLYVANTGGYAFSEGHDYENTISVVDAASMKKVQDVEILRSPGGERVVNLYGNLSQNGRYLCINSAGDYMSCPAATVIFNCKDCSYTVYDFPSTYNTATIDGNFFSVGSDFSYETYEYQYFYTTIDPLSGEVHSGYLLPGSSVAASEVEEVLLDMDNPYCAYQNPYTGHLYVTDAGSFASAGKVYEFDTEGHQVGEPLKCYINPGHMIAIP